MVYAFICAVIVVVMAGIEVIDWRSSKRLAERNRKWLENFRREDREMNERLDKLFDAYKPKK